MEGYFQLGYLRKKHGYKGEVILHVESDHPARYASLDVLFFEEAGQPIPYFISSIRTHVTSEFILRLEDADDEASVQALVGKAVYLPEEALPELDEDQYYYHEIIGFDVKDQAVAETMTLEDVIERPGQPLLVLSHPERENPIYIPLVDEFVVSMDKKAKCLTLAAPAELYFMGE